ncbi:MAG TPA: PspC domain-containing protein [Jatrophihabitantaceae bacterium]|nr:PspC domain-containing protein [Jatrophihabitantaceae bacterium]
MTTTEHFGGATPPPPPPSAGGQPQRVLRRSHEDRIAAGVSGGLGEYFGVDPVLFRVLFATAAFFGGAGVLAYLIAWAVIPEAGTANAPIDRFVAGLRRRRIPVWLVVAAAALFFWAIAFSWWAPGHFVPVWILVIVLVAVFVRRGRRSDHAATVPPPPSPGADAPTISLDKDAVPTAGAPVRPTWMDETREWIAESKAARRERRMRAFPLRIGAIVALVATIAILAAFDATKGVALPVYPWVTFGIVGVALLAGLVLRRTPWSLTVLLVPAIVGIVAFGTTSASLHDGSGQRDWTPTTGEELKSEYRLAFGQGTLDLRGLPSLTEARSVDITMSSGQVRIIFPAQMNTKVVASVHLGHVIVDDDSDSDSGGFGVNRTIPPNQGATGAPLTVNVHLADGEVAVEHRG